MIDFENDLASADVLLKQARAENRKLREVVKWFYYYIEDELFEIHPDNDGPLKELMSEIRREKFHV